MWTVQSTFSKGEIDPQLNSKIDTEMYYSGVNTALNVLLIPQGGLRVRYGMEYLATAVNGRLEPFTSSTGVEYVLLFDNTKMYVYKAGVLQTNINGSGNSYLTIPHTTAQMVDADYIQAGDTIILTHEDVDIHKILWGGDTIWTIATSSSFITNMPTYDWNDSYSPSGTAEVQTLTFVRPTISDRFKLSIYGILTEEIAYAGNTGADQQNGTARNIQQALQDHPLFKSKTVTVAYSGAGLAWTITMDAGLPYPVGLITVAAVYTRQTTFTGTSAITTTGVARAQPVWSADLSYSITGATNANPCVVTCTGHTFSNGDRVTITGVGGMTQLNGNIYVVANKAANTFELSGVNSGAYGVYTSGGTATRHGRGWPRSVCFHEGRLYFGGSKELPTYVWGSSVNDYFNFRAGRGLDDNAVTFSVPGDKANKINEIFSNGTLQVFTTDYEFYVPASPITPETVAAKIQTSIGAKRMHIVNLDGDTIFVSKTGKSLHSFAYVNDTQSNKTVSISMLSPHLIKNPVQMVLRHGTEDIDATYLYIVNEDGTVTVLNSLSTENIAAFTRWETDGNIKSMCAIGNDLYFLVERTIGGVSVYYLEKENSEMATDSGKRTAGVDSVTMSGLDHLEGETVKIRALSNADVAAGYTGGAQVPDDTVVSGDVTLPRAFDTIEAGLDYDVDITTMPLNVNTNAGAGIFKKKRIMKCGLDLYEANGILVNGAEINTRVIGQSQFSAPQPFTGKKLISLGGWSYDAQVSITRGSSHIFQILSIGLEVRL